MGRALPLVLLCLGLPATVWGATVPRSGAEAEAELFLGMRAEGEGAFARALEHYRACLEGQGSSRIARNARNRIMWIEERSEGDFLPLATLARVRRDPTVLADPAKLDKLATEVETFPAGLVRSELRLRMAEAQLRREGGHAAGMAGLRAVIGDASSGASDRRLAVKDLVAALLAAGQLDDAREEVEAHPFDPESTAKVERLVHRRWQVRGAGLLGTLALLGLALGTRTYVRRRGQRRGAHAAGTRKAPDLSLKPEA